MRKYSFLPLKKKSKMLNIIDLETQFSKQKISKSKKLSLREIEEDKKNHFICFVDEGEESYDAQISISEKLEIIDFDLSIFLLVTFKISDLLAEFDFITVSGS